MYLFFFFINWAEKREKLESTTWWWLLDLVLAEVVVARPEVLVHLAVLTKFRYTPTRNKKRGVMSTAATPSTTVSQTVTTATTTMDMIPGSDPSSSPKNLKDCTTCRIMGFGILTGTGVYTIWSALYAPDPEPLARGSGSGSNAGAASGNLKNVFMNAFGLGNGNSSAAAPPSTSTSTTKPTPSSLVGQKSSAVVPSIINPANGNGSSNNRVVAGHRIPLGLNTTGFGKHNGLGRGVMAGFGARTS